MQSLDNFKELLPSEFVNDLELYQNDKYIGININKVHVYNLIKFLKENEKFNFKQLIDITAIDYPAKEHRFNLVYILLSYYLMVLLIVKKLHYLNKVLE